MASDAPEDIKILVKANKNNSKHKTRLCHKFTKTGVDIMNEYSNPIYQLLSKVKKEAKKMNKQYNIKEMSKKETILSQLPPGTKRQYCTSKFF